MAYNFETEKRKKTNRIKVDLACAETYNGKKYKFDNIIEYVDFILCGELKGYTLFAHNAKGFDLQFLFNKFLKRNVVVEGIYTGMKIMWLILPGYNIKFKDLMNFISGPLAATFGLTESRKEFFPHHMPSTRKVLRKHPDMSSLRIGTTWSKTNHSNS